MLLVSDTVQFGDRRVVVMQQRGRQGGGARQEQREHPATLACFDCAIQDRGSCFAVHEITRLQAGGQEGERQPDEHRAPVGDDAHGNDGA